MDFSSTDIRQRVERNEDISALVSPAVAKYIAEKQLWTLAGNIVRLTAALEQRESAQLYIERGKCHYRRNEWGSAINDFNSAKRLEPDNEEAQQLHDMVYEILSFRYKDIYNP